MNSLTFLVPANLQLVMLFCVEPTAGRKTTPVNRSYHCEVIQFGSRRSDVQSVRRGLSLGGIDAQREPHLIVSEKVDATIEVTASLMSGATVTNVINQLRELVVANITRLSAENCITTFVLPLSAFSPTEWNPTNCDGT